MRKINTNDLLPGMELATDVYNFNEQLIMVKGSILDDKFITKLSFYAIPYVYIEAEDEEEVDYSAATEIEQKDDGNSDSYMERVRASEEFKLYKKEFERVVDSLQDSVRKMINENAPLDVMDPVIEDALLMLQGRQSNAQVFDMLHNMRQYDDLTFAHSLNVGTVAYVFAKWLNLTEEEAKLALVCGLFHDIGKLLIPESIITKPGKLTKEEYSLVKTHPIEGYNALRKYDVDEHVRNTSLMHHEKYDGSGYPIGMSGKQIDPYARLIAIVDVYEATTAARIYRAALCPFKVIEMFENEGLQKYDTKMIMTFLENIVNTYLQDRVRLSDGRVGEIIFINHPMLSKPVVKCGDKYVDLSKEKDLYIEEIL